MKTRRWFLGLAAASVAPLHAQPNTEEGVFAELFNEWVTLHWRDEHFNGVQVNATAMQQWKGVKESWKRMQRHVDDHYA